MAVSAVNGRGVGVLPQLQVAAAGLLANAVLRGVKKSQESWHVLGGEGHPDDANKHGMMRIDRQLAKAYSKILSTYQPGWP